MDRIYIRVHPQSKLGESYTKAHSRGWELVCLKPNENGLHYPIFRETFFRWFKRKIIRHRGTISDYYVHS